MQCYATLRDGRKVQHLYHLIFLLVMGAKKKNFSANFAMDEMTSHRLSMPNFYILKIHISDKIRKRDDYFFLKEIRERETCASYSGTNYSSFNALKDVVLRRWQNLFLHWLLNFSQLERLGIPGGGGGGTWINFCWVCAAGLSEPLPHYSLFRGQL